MTSDASLPREVISSELLSRRGIVVERIESFGGGANSHAYRIECSGGAPPLLAKQYILRRGDVRDRLGTEFQALRFLWQQGIRSIPEPVLAMPQQGVGIYGFIEGRTLEPQEITQRDVQQAAGFVRDVHGLRSVADAQEQPEAAEACFTLQAYLDNVAGRLSRLRELSPSSPVHEGLLKFLREALEPAFDEVREFVMAEAPLRELDPHVPLAPHQRTLSQSDFGFQNIIRRPGGELAVIDFEYFGWDDPSKLVSDFFLQPRIPVARALYREFYDAVLPALEEDDQFARRLGLVYPVLSLKWCLIMLNIFLHEGMVYNNTVLSQRLQQATSTLESARTTLREREFPIRIPEKKS